MDSSFDNDTLLLLRALNVTNVCQTFTTMNNTVVSIDDNKQESSSSSGLFNLEYTILKKLDFETASSMYFVGNGIDGSEVVVKRLQFDDRDGLAKYLINGMPKERFIQMQVENITFEGGKGKVLKIFDWYIYDTYCVIVMEKKCKALSVKYHKHMSEDDCRDMFLLLSKFVLELNNAGIFHLNLRPKYIVYNSEEREVKLLTFGNSIVAKKGENPLISGTSGTFRIRTPQKVEKCHLREVDEWGVAQVLFFCLQGD